MFTFSLKTLSLNNKGKSLKSVAWPDKKMWDCVQKISLQTKVVKGRREKRKSLLVHSTQFYNKLTGCRRCSGMWATPGFCGAQHTRQHWDFPLLWERWQPPIRHSQTTAVRPCPPPPPWSPEFQRMAKKIFFLSHSANLVCIKRSGAK